MQVVMHLLLDLIYFVYSTRGQKMCIETDLPMKTSGSMDSEEDNARI